MRPSSSSILSAPPGFGVRTLRLGAWGLIAVALATCGEPTATKTPGAGTKLAFTTQPTTATAGATISPAVVVTVRDNNGITDAGYTGNVTLTITTGTGTAGATLAGTLTAPVTQGVATFSDLRINRSGTGYTLSAAAPSLTLTAPSAAFSINPGPAVKLIFTTQPITTVAGASITPAVVVTARDLNDNTATSFAGSVAISFGTNPVAGTLTGTATLNATGGVASFNSLKINKVATGYTLKATSLGLTEDVSASFNINPGPAATLVFSGQPSNVVAGAAISPAVVVTALDGQGNVATGFAAAVTLAFGNNPGSGALTSASVSAAAGVATFPALSINKTGTGYTLSASSGSLNTPVPSAAFNVTPGTANKLAFTVQASNVVAGALMTPAVVVEVQDANGNRVTTSTASVTVAIGPNPPGASSLGGTTVLSAVAGVATFSTLTLNKTGTGYTLTAASTGLTSGTGAGFNVTPGADAKLVFGAALPATVTAGVVIAPVTVRVLDANDNLTASTATITMAIGTNNGGGTLSGTTSVNASSGVASFTTLKIDKVGAGYTLVAASTVPATLTGATSTAFNIMPATATKLVFTGQPASAVAGVVIGGPITVSAQDQFGNVDPAFIASVTLGFANNAGSGTLGGTVIKAASGGIVTFSDITINKTATGYTLQASSGALTQGTSNVFAITPAAAAQVAFTTQPAVLAVAGALLNAGGIQVSVQDQFGNLQPGFAGSVTVSLSSGAVQLYTSPSPAATPTASVTATIASGVATFSTLTIHLAGTGYKLNANTTGLTGGASILFDVKAAPADHLAYDQEPTNAVAGIGLSPTVTVSARDPYANIDGDFTGASKNVTLTVASGPAGTLVNATATPSAGVATFATFSIQTAGLARTLNAAGGGLTVESASFNITAAAANHLVFTGEPANAVAGVAITGPSGAVRVAAQDQFGNIDLTYTTAIVLSVNTGPAAVLNGPSVSASAGVATFTGFNVETAGSYTLKAASGTLSAAAPVSASFVISPAADDHLAFLAQPTTAVAGVAIAPAITVQILDAFDNLTTSTATVGMAIGTNAGGAALTGTTSLAAVGGVATFSTLKLDKVGTGYTLAATSTVPVSLTGATSALFNITHATATKLVFTSQPASAVAGVAIGGPITVSAQDQFGNVDPAFVASVTLAFANNAGSGTLGGTLIKAASGGVVTFSDITIDKTATGYTLQASSGALAQGTSNVFAITPAAAAQVAFTTQPAVLAVAGALLNAGGIQVSVQDQFGNLQPGFAGSVTVSLSSGAVQLYTSPSPAATPTASVTATIASGVATFSTLTIHLPGTGYKLNANTTGLTGGASILFDVKAAPADHLVYDQEPTSAVAGIGLSPTVTVSARDPYANIDGDFTGASKNVTLTVASGPAGTLVNATATPSAGVATFTTFNIQTAGLARTLNATGGGLTVESASFNITPAAANHLVFTGEPGDALAGAAITGTSGPVQVTALDPFNNVDLNYTTSVVLSVNSGPAAVLISPSANASAGVATFTGFNVETAGTYTLKAASGTLSAAAPVSASFVISPAADDHLAFLAQPTTAVAGVAIAPAITVQILDAFDNLTTSTATVGMAIGTNAGGAALTGTTSLAAVGGVATFSTLKLDKVGTGYTLAATSTVPVSLTGATSALFNITHATATKLAFTGQPASAVAGVAIGGPITVTAQDQFGNPDLTFVGSVTLAFANNAGGGALGGTLIKAASGGSVTFSDIVITKAATGYTLQSSSGALAQGTSNAFAITPATAVQLAVTTQPPVLAVAGVPLGLAVSVQDQYGNLQPAFAGSVTASLSSNLPLLYTSALPSATASATVTATISGGVATFSTLNIHFAGNGYKLDANSTGLTGASSIQFDVKAAPADQLLYTQSPVNAVAGVTQSPAIAVSAYDPYSNLDLDFTGVSKNVTLTVASGPAGTLVNATATPSAGVATFTSFNIQTAGLARTLNATGGGLTVESGVFDIIAAAANHLVFTLSPDVGPTAAGLPLTQVDVTARDQFNNTDLTYTNSVSVSIATNPSAGVLSGGGPQNAVAGVATFTGLSINKTGTGYTLQATDGTINSTLPSGAFDIEAAPADHLVFTQSPAVGPTVAGQSLTQVQVTARDQFENTDLDYTGSVTVSINPNPSTGVLSGVAAQSAVNGVATFNGLSIDKTGTGYTLRADGDGPISSSSPSDGFNITNAAATKLGYVQQPLTAAPDATISPDVVVAAQDQFGNTVPTFAGNATISIGFNPNSGVLSGTLSQPFSLGLATFNDLSIDNLGTGYQLLTVSSPVLTQVLSTAFNITN